MIVSGSDAHSNVQPLCPGCPPDFLPLFLRRLLVRLSSLAAIDSCEGGILLLWLSLGGLFLSSCCRCCSFSLRVCISNCRALIIVCRRSFSANSSETNLRIEDGSVQSFSNSFLMSASCSFIDTKIHKTIQTAKQKWHLFY